MAGKEGSSNWVVGTGESVGASLKRTCDEVEVGEDVGEGGV